MNSWSAPQITSAWTMLEMKRDAFPIMNDPFHGLNHPGIRSRYRIGAGGIAS